MRSLSITVFDAEPPKKCAEALENENCAVRFPETVKPVAAKGRESTYKPV
jgi:hypothetical protein